MRIVRSFPATIPAGRAYVVDALERVTLSDFDYAPLAALDDDVIVVEWDMALSREDTERFTCAARRRPDQVTVAPYLLYTVAQNPVFAHRCIGPSGRERWINDLDWFADYIGFGLVYLPRAVVRAFLDAPAPARGRSPYLPDTHEYGDTRFSDQTFSVWHRHSYGRRTLIQWDVRPVHLHY